MGTSLDQTQPIDQSRLTEKMDNDWFFEIFPEEEDVFFDCD